MKSKGGPDSRSATEFAIGHGQGTSGNGDQDRQDQNFADAHLRDRLFGVLLSVVLAVLVGYLWNAKPQMSPNDNARWDTIWSLVDFGTYQIFDTEEDAKKFDRPKQLGTIDKVVVDGRTYSSKPPLLPTVMAGVAKLVKVAIREPFSLEDKTDPKKGSFPIYSKVTLFVFNALPFALFMVYYRRFLDRFDLDFELWLFCLLFAATGTLLTGYLATLNNHTLAAQLAFFAGYHLIRLVYDGQSQWWRFAAIGLFSTLSATCELPAGLLAAFALIVCFRKDWRKTLFGYVPPAALVTAAFFATNYFAIGTLKPAYLQKQLYDFPGSYWTGNEKSGIDALNDHPESKLLYLVQMTVGHHGLFSLTPVWLFGLVGTWSLLRRTDSRLPGMEWPIAVATAIVFGFYWLLNSERNYGGFCHGMRWLLWLAPFWLMLLPASLQRIATGDGARKLLWSCLVVSCVSMADTLYNPWTRAWLHRIMLWFGVVDY